MIQISKAWNSFYFSLDEDMQQFLLDNDDIRDEVQYYIDHEGDEDFALEALKAIKENPSIKFSRYKELNDLVKEDPWALIENCAEENGLNTSNYLDLYNHGLPNSCINRLDALGSSFENQPLNEGNAACANIDYYSVEITQNPDFNDDGQPDSNDEIYEAFRNNFTSLASGEKNNFHFIGVNITADIHWDFMPYDTFDDNLWSSNQNPLTVIFGIDAGSPNPLIDLTSDLGAIMISGYTNDHFIGSTISTYETGSQPFSGNREWGIFTNENGNLEIYTRAVDVAKISRIIKLNPFTTNESDELNYYDVADVTWQNFQNKVQTWVNNHNGQANISTTETIKIDKDKIKKLLEANETIDQIGCN